MGEGEPPVAVLRDDLSASVKVSEASDIYSRGFGERDGEELLLRPYEAAFLLEKGKIRLRSESGGYVDFDSYVSTLSAKIENFWLRYVIYRDLRRRGHLVREGIGQTLSYRLYEKGRRDHAKYLVYPFFEGSPRRVSEILEAARQSMSKDKSMIVAVVERRGEVIYYLCTATQPTNL